MSVFSKVHALLTPSERRAAVVLLGMMVVGAVLETLGLGLVIPALAIFMEPNLAATYPWVQPTLDALGNPTQNQLVTGAMVGLVGIYLIKTLFLGFLAWWQGRFAFGVQARLSEQLFGIYLHQTYTFHLQRNSAQLIRNVMNDVSAFSFFCMLPSLMFCTEVLVLAGIVGLLLVVQPVGALIVILVLGASGWMLQRATRGLVAQWGHERQYHEGLRTQHLQEGLGGAKDVKVFGRESHFLARYRLHNSRNARVAQLQFVMQQMPRLWLELLAAAGLAVLVLTMLARGETIISVLLTLGLFGTAAFRLMPSATRVLSAVQSFRFGLPVIDTLFEEFQLAQPEAPARNSLSPPFSSTIRLANVGFTYLEGAAPAIKGLSVAIAKGETVGFIGPSGCGKSTLVDVILGLLTPSSGQVLVDGRDIQTCLREWQDQIGYVPQSIYLIDDTLRRNVAFGLPDDQIDEEAVRRAIKAAQLEEFVASHPDGLDAIVGERGVRLSGGQHQRIGIARALYHDPAVLVLDEATSALDVATERGVMDAVDALHGAKTVLIVAHRFSTVEHCDRIYRLESGAVTAEGQPHEMHAVKETASVAR